MKPWKSVDRRVVFAHPLFNLEQRTLQAQGPPGIEPPEDAPTREALVLDSADWVHAVPVLPDGRVLLIRQWRYGTESFHLEIPGGLVDPGEEPLDAVRRELSEETGYRAGAWHRLGSLDPNPAIQGNRLHVFLARELEKVTEPHGDDEEEIELVPTPAEEIPGLVAEGSIRHGLMVASFYLWRLMGQG